MASEVNNQQPVLSENWTQKAKKSGRDLVIKKLAIVLIALLNFAALGLAVYYIIEFAPIPSKAFLISPLVGGVLGALAFMKFPTFGVSKVNYTEYTNPANLIGKGLGYIFFGPLILAVKHIDFTPYHDPEEAFAISTELETYPFKAVQTKKEEKLPPVEIATKYRNTYENLVNYGFIDAKYLDELKAIFEAYVPLKRELDYLKQGRLGDQHPDMLVLNGKFNELNKKWATLRDQFKDELPKPKRPEYDFTTLSHRIKLWARKNFLFNAIVDVKIPLHA